MALIPATSIGGSGMPVMPNTYNSVESLGQVETCDFDIEDRHGALNPAVFNSLLVADGATTIFRGDVDETELTSFESPYRPSGPTPQGARKFHIRGVGLSHLARRQLTGAFSAQARIEISLVVQTLATPLGITMSIATNPSSLKLPDSFLSEQETLADAFTRLADIATAQSGIQHIWRIGDLGGTVTFQFQPVTSLSPSGSIGTGGYSARSGSIRYRITREQFANSVVLKLDRYLKDGGAAQVENYVGSDIFLGTLTLDYPAASQPSIKVNGDDETVGIKDVDTGKDWYWSVGSTVLKVGDSSASGSDTIEVTYAGHDLRSVTSESSSSISSVGLFRVPMPSSDSGNVASPTSQAGAELSRRLGLIEHLRLEVKCPSGIFYPGQLVSVTLAGFGSSGTSSLTGNFVLQMLRTYDQDGIVLWREMELTRGPLLYRASQFMGRLGR